MADELVLAYPNGGGVVLHKCPECRALVQKGDLPVHIRKAHPDEKE